MAPDNNDLNASQRRIHAVELKFLGTLIMVLHLQLQRQARIMDRWLLGWGVPSFGRPSNPEAFARHCFR